MKAKIFIGSSKESLPIARKIKDFFDVNYDTTIWEADFFQLNQSTYDNLLEQSPLYDYAIFVGGIDDLVIRTGTLCKKKKVRDNVYFELGLYTGILSKERTFFFIHQDAQIASDLCGITLIFFKEDILPGCQQVKNKIEAEEKIARVSLLPSTSLAIDYYKNFLEPLGEQLRVCTNLTVSGSNYSVQTQSVQIFIPQDCNTNLKDFASMLYITHKCGNHQFLGVPRDFSVKFDLEALTAHGELKIIDVPQTLRASFDAVDMVTKKDYVGSTNLSTGMKKKEIANFIKTLSNLLRENSFLKDKVTIYRS